MEFMDTVREYREKARATLEKVLASDQVLTVRIGCQVLKTNAWSALYCKSPTVAEEIEKLREVWFTDDSLLRPYPERFWKLSFYENGDISEENLSVFDNFPAFDINHTGPFRWTWEVIVRLPSGEVGRHSGYAPFRWLAVKQAQKEIRDWRENRSILNIDFQL